MATTDVNAIGRLWDDRPDWFGIARVKSPRSLEEPERPAYSLVFGEPGGVTRVPAGAGPRGVLLALIAFFEGEAPEPPPELEMTQGEAADAVRSLAAGAADEDFGAPLREALDAIDDGLPADVVTSFLYRSLEATPAGGLAAGATPIDEVRRTYERLGR